MFPLVERKSFYNYLYYYCVSLHFNDNQNGLEATRLLRRQGFDGLIVGATGHVFEEDVAAFLDAGADLVLAKPLAMNTVQMLLTCIAENISLGSVTLTHPSGTGSRLQVEQKHRLLIEEERSRR